MPICMLIIGACKNNGDTTSTDKKTDSSSTTAASKDTPPTTSGPSFETAQSYNDYIIGKQRVVYDYIFKMSDAAKISPDAADKVIDEAIPAIGKTVADIKAMPSFKGDVAFRDAAVSLFEFYKTTFETSYKQIIAFNKKGDKLTKDDATKMQQISAEVSQKEAGLDMAMKTAQQAFATANNMQIQANTELQQKVDNMGK